jgi:hypothetical protein
LPGCRRAPSGWPPRRETAGGSVTALSQSGRRWRWLTTTTWPSLPGGAPVCSASSRRGDRGRSGTSARTTAPSPATTSTSSCRTNGRSTVLAVPTPATSRSTCGSTGPVPGSRTPTSWTRASPPAGARPTRRRRSMRSPSRLAASRSSRARGRSTRTGRAGSSRGSGTSRCSFPPELMLGHHVV